MKELININDFSGGININDRQQSFNSFKEVFGLNIWRNPGYLSPNDGFTASTGNPSADANSYTYFDNAGKYIAHEKSATTIRSFSDGKVWSTATFTTNGVQPIYHWIQYMGYLIYAQTDEIGYFEDDLTTGDNTFQTVTDTNDFHVMVYFNNRVYIADGNSINELDGSAAPGTPASWTYTSDVFVIQAEETITTMELFGDRIAIGTDLGNFYLWDGTSSNADQIINTGYSSIYRILEHENTLFIFMSSTAFYEDTIYQYNGADLVPVIQMPKTKSYGTTYYGYQLLNHQNYYSIENGIYFIVYSIVSSSSVIFVLNRKTSAEGYSLVKYGDNDVFTNTIDSFFVSNKGMMLICYGSGTWKWSDITDEDTTGGILETNKYLIENTKGFDTLIKAIKVQGGPCDMQYSLDEGAYTSAVSLTDEELLRVNKRAKTMQLKLTSLGKYIRNIKIYS